MSRPLRASERLLALTVADTVSVIAAVLLALWTWSLTAGFPFNTGFVLGHAVWLLAVPLWVVGLGPTRRPQIALDVAATARGIVHVAGVLLLVYMAAFFWVGGERLPRLVALYVLWNATLLAFGWRVAIQWWFTRAPFSRRILVVGSGSALTKAFVVLDDPSFRDATIIGVATTDPPGEAWPAPIVGTPLEIDVIARRLNVTDVVVALDRSAGEVEDVWVQRLLRCQEAGSVVIRMAQLYEDRLRRVPVEHLEASWLLTNFFDVARSRDSSPLAKRLLDVVVASAVAAVGVVLTPVISLAIVIDSGRPLLYRQDRLGRGGRPFRMTKFRTMRQDAEGDGHARWSTPVDPRVTRIGRLLRRTRLDELPNVFAVLRGEMSMVGPRPERPQFVEHLEREVPFYRARLTVAPGLTGWAQVNSAYGDSVADAVVKLEYDLYYIKHQSFWFDALILVKTVGTMLRFGGQ